MSGKAVGFLSVLIYFWYPSICCGIGPGHGVPVDAGNPADACRVLLTAISEMQHQLTVLTEKVDSLQGELTAMQVAQRPEIHSLNVVVPVKTKCWNNCGFCVSQMRDREEERLNYPDGYNCPAHQDHFLRMMKERLQFVKDAGCDNIMLTGITEPQQNKEFLKAFGAMNKGLPSPFHKIEIQTTGTAIDREYLRLLRDEVGVNFVAMSVSAFDTEANAANNGTKGRLKVNIPEFTKMVKEEGLNLRLTVILTDYFNDKSPEWILKRARELGADQVTFKVLYQSGDGATKQDQWIKEHRASPEKEREIRQFAIDHGKFGGHLVYGAEKYALYGMSVVFDDDCMSKKVRKNAKFYILRQDGKIYSQWDDTASLVY